MKRTFILLIAALLTGCGTTKRFTRMDASATMTGHTSTDLTTQSAGYAAEKISGTSVTEKGSERMTTTTETTIFTEFSTPDSTGNQHKIKEITTTRKTYETELKDATGKQRIDTDRTSSMVVSDSLHTTTNTASEQTVSAVEDKVRKRNIGGYLLAFGTGIVVTAGACVVIWCWRKRKSLTL